MAIRVCSDYRGGLTMGYLKSFPFTNLDMQFMKRQIDFRPLFSAAGDPIINWNGVGAIYDATGALVWDGLGLSPADAVAEYGISFPTYTSSIGLRNLDGLYNNLFHYTWGNTNLPFLQRTQISYDSYVKPLSASDPNAFYGKKFATAQNADYTKIGDNLATADVNEATSVQNVVDYTPRMISRLVTTAGVTFNTAGDGTTHLAKDQSGYTSVQDYGQLLGGQHDVQKGLNGDIGPNGFVADGTVNDEYFFGSINPGVAPVNGWFALFGQFFDHGLDFIGKGADGTKITINLAVDDPMYGVIDPTSGMPATKIVISRANISGFTADGTPQWDNHTSPFIDQSQTYGSTGEVTNLLREWVLDPVTGNYKMGMRLLDGNQTVAWTNAWGETTTATLPTLNELRRAVIDTGRDALTWDDVLELRMRDEQGKLIDFNPSTSGVQTKGSGEPLLLDMNPVFDGKHLFDSLNPDAASKLTQDIALLHDSIANGPLGQMGYEFGYGNVDGNGTVSTTELGDASTIYLKIPADGMGPGSPAMTLSGASALYFWVNFSDFSIKTSMQAGGITIGDVSDDIHSAVSDILLASVGNHYIAGDGRVNENIGLTAVHHVFHEEHNFQINNIIRSLYDLDRREVALDMNGSYGHDVLKDWQVSISATGQPSSAHVVVVDGHYEAGADAVLAINENGDYYVTGRAFDATVRYVTVKGSDLIVENGQVINACAATGSCTYANGYVSWNEESLFNAAKMTVEMEYQHTAVDQFARTITPNIAEFVGYNSSVDSTISMDFSQVAYRFGHSTLRESIDLMDPNGSISGSVMRVALERAFLAPDKFGAVGAGALALGMTHQQANEIDEFLTPAMNQGLLGQPLDLAAINIARGRDVGIPTLNEMRVAIGLNAYVSWADFGKAMIHPDNLVNFIAAYSFDGNVDRAQLLLDLASAKSTDANYPALLANEWGYTVRDAVNFLHNLGDATSDKMYGSDGFDHIDTWLGGLAEVHVTGGLLGETFDTIFVDQITRLMDGDRFYYLQRLSNIPYGQQIIDEQFKDMIERTTGVQYLNGSAFAYADQYYELARNAVGAAPTGPSAAEVASQHKYGTVLSANPDIGIYSDGGSTDLLNGDLVTVNGKTYVQDLRVENEATADNNFGLALDGTPNSGADSNEVIVGSDRDDLIYARVGDDTIYGEGGDDILYGGGGIDRLYGGAGADIIYGDDGGDLIDGGDGDDALFGGQSATAAAGVDQVIGSAGNDYVDGGIGIDKLSGSEGDDVIFGGQDTDPFTHGGEGNDYIDGGGSGDLLWGDNGDDVIVGQEDQDIVAGMEGDDILRPGPLSQSLTNGGDEVLGGDGTSDAGNDGKGIGFDLLDLSDWQKAPKGATFDLINQNNPLPAIDGAPQFPAVAQIEGVIGTQNDDAFTGDAGNNWLIGGSGNDMLAGSLGNDLIIGDGIRLDTLIGVYQDAQGNRSSYDYFFDGASHRATGYTSADEVLGDPKAITLGSNGLLDAIGWGDQKHFTELLKSAMFKDYVLGGSEVTTLYRSGDASLPGQTGEQTGVMGDGGMAGSQDTAVFVGNYADYTITTLFFDLSTRSLVQTSGPNTIQVVKVSDNVADRDGTDVVVGVESFKFADRTVTIGKPSVDLHAFDAGNFRDQFSSNSSYGGSNGTTPWTTSWMETGDRAGQVANSGEIRINNGALEFVRDTANPTNPLGASITRGVDLSAVGASGTATLSLNWSQNSQNRLEPGEKVDIQFSADGQSWTTLGTVGDGTFSRNGNLSYDLTGPFTANAAVRFVFSGVTDTTGFQREYIRLDNVDISFKAPVNDGINWESTFTEKGSAAALSLNSAVANSDVFASARIVLKNASAGDDLSTTGISVSGNNRLYNVVKTTRPDGAIQLDITLRSGLPMSAVQVQAALDAIRYSNNSAAPDTTDRIIEVTVNNGVMDSDPAIATVHVVAVDDPMVANSDSVYTNFGNNNTFSVPLWALLANDTDPDSPLGISAVINPNSLSVSLGTTAVTVTDTGQTSGGSFTYRGTGTDTANVTVTEASTFNNANGNITGNNADNIIIGDNRSSTIIGGQGNDIVLAGGGDDTIIWNANNSGSTDGRDFIDGGSNGTAGDTFVVNGRGNTTERFDIYTRAEFLALANVAALLGNQALNADTEIVITRTTFQGGSTSIIAELDNIEEIRINTLDVTANNGGGLDQGATVGDTVAVHGDFTTTSLKYSTITVEGSGGDDTVDITDLRSAHRIVFRSNGGNDTIVGALRPQDVIEVPTGMDPAGYQTVANGDGTITMSNGSHSITCYGSAPILVPAGADQGSIDDDDTLPPVDDGSGGEVPGEPVPPSDQDYADDDGDDDGDATVHAHTMIGTDAHDALSGTSGDDTLVGGKGNDVLSGAGGADILRGDEGDDVLLGGDGADVISGGVGNDEVHAGHGNDVVFGADGDDLIFADGGNDIIEGGAGADRIWTGTGDDTVLATAGDGDDIYHGEDGVDTLDYSAAGGNLTVDLGNGFMARGGVSGGQTGNDTFYGFENFVGGSGNDTITASSAVNIIDGGLGEDVFKFNSAAQANGDVIYGFQTGDRIDFSGMGHFTLQAGTTLDALGEVTVAHEVHDGHEFTVIRGNTQGDDAADFQLTLDGHHNLTSNDFIGVS